MEKEIFYSSISSILLFVGNIPYLLNTINGKTFPHPISFIVWTVLTGFNAYVLFNAHEYYSLVPAILGTVFCGVFTILGCIHHEKIRVHLFDKICIFLIVLTGPYWFTSYHILHTVVLTVLIDFLAFLLVFKKGWMEPWSETLIAYFIPGVVNLFMLSANLHQTLETVLFWFYVFVINMCFVLMMVFRRISVKGGGSIFQ